MTVETEYDVVRKLMSTLVLAVCPFWYKCINED